MLAFHGVIGGRGGTINAMIGRWILGGVPDMASALPREREGSDPMTQRTRKFVGAVALLLFLTVYALAAMMVAIALQVNGSKLAEIVYYPVAGLLWVLPSMWLVSWMQRPDAPPPARQP